MKTKKTKYNPQFSAIDLLTLTNFSVVHEKLDKILFNDKIKKRFKEVVGGVSNKGVAMTQLRKQDRYIIKQNKKNKIWIGLGFWFNVNKIEEYPNVGLVIEIDPTSDKKKEVVEIFKSILDDKNADWKPYLLNQTNDQKTWSYIAINENLSKFLNEENHSEKLKDFFNCCLDEYEKVIPRLQEYL